MMPSMPVDNTNLFGNITGSSKKKKGKDKGIFGDNLLRF
jgi:hypothetical protein